MERLLKSSQPPKFYKKILLKLSGEALAGKNGYGIDPQVLKRVASEIQWTYQKNVQIAIVIGGGNIFRGFKGATEGMNRAQADDMGMLATVLNALALQDALEQKNISTRVLSAIQMEKLVKSYTRRKAIKHLEKNRIVIFAGGSGNPYFTTDTAAALRALEIGAEVVLKATHVDGIYDKDPKENSNLKCYDRLSYLEILQKGLKIMDSTAVSLCMDHQLPMIVFNLNQPGALKEVVEGKMVGTLVQ